MVWLQTFESPRMPQRGEAERGGSPQGTLTLSAPASPAATIRAGRPGSPAGQNVTPVRKVMGARLPREGACLGGGEISVVDRGWHAKTIRCAQEPEMRDWKMVASKSTGSISDAGRSDENRSALHRSASATWHGSAAQAKGSPGSKSDGSFHRSASATWHAGGSPTKGSPCSGSRGWRPRPDLVAKQERLNARRQLDQARIAEKVEHGKQRREDRFDRLLNETFSGTHKVFDGISKVRQHELHEEQRRRDLHANWGEKVYQPLETQILDHMNPPHRALEQSLSGSKSVGFQIPGQSFKLQVHREDDPTCREMADHAWEDAFDREATAVLSGFSTWDLRAAGADPNRGLSPPAARSKPVLDPTMWGQQKLQGTLFGRFAQVVEEGPNVRMGKRGAPDISAPCESDGVACAGKRSIRAGPHVVQHHDTGMLRRDGAAWNGESFLNRSSYGASSGAPVQDHYTYETGGRVTDVEFPLGKRMYPSFP